MVHVVVVGGGVNGIGTAMALLQKAPKCHVTVVSKDFSPDTTGDGAAGLWGPYLAGTTPKHKILQWSQDTWNLFRDWWKSDQIWGVSLVPGVTISRQELPEEPWRHIPVQFSDMTQEELNKFGEGYCSGYRYTAFIAEASKFLPKLTAEIQSHGGTFEKKSVESLEEVASQADIIINCSGLSARYLAPDDSVFPSRGQTMRVRAPWLNQYFIDESEESFCYIFPNTDTVVLGGTQQENDWRREPDPEDAKTIWRNCTQLVPSLKMSEVVRDWVGLRPCRRDGIRVEADEIKVYNRKVPVVHNYGHGGCGISTFWGCSQEAASIAADIIHKQYEPVSKL